MSDFDIDCHVVFKVVVSGDENVAISILEADARALVEPVEVFDSGDDRIGVVMRRNHNSHR